MDDLTLVNVSALKDYKSSFDSELNHFNNTAYDNFNSSYLKRCSDPYIYRMNTKLNEMFNTIKKGYGNIDEWWSEYITNVEGLENTLSNDERSGNLELADIRNFINNKLQKLEDFNLSIAGIITPTIDRVKDPVKFANNEVMTNFDQFSDLYKGYESSFDDKVDVKLEEKGIFSEAKAYVYEKTKSLLDESKEKFKENPKEFIKDVVITGAKIAVIAGCLSGGSSNKKEINEPEDIFSAFDNKLNEVKEDLSKNVDILKETAEVAGKVVAKSAIDAVENISEVNDAVGNFIKDIPASALGKIGINTDDVKERASIVVDAAEQFVTNTINSGKNKLEDIDNQISNIKSFTEDKVNDFIENPEGELENLFNSAKTFAINTSTTAATAAIEGFESITKEIQEIPTEVTAWAEGVIEKFEEDPVLFVLDTFENTLATGATVVNSLVEGIGQFGEAILDFGSILSSFQYTKSTVLADIGQSAMWLLWGREFESLTLNMWNETKGFVATEHVKTWYDQWYENDFIGNWIYNNAYGFENVRGVGSGVGYTAGVVLLTVLTAGVGGAAVGGGAAATSTATTATVTASQLAVTATAAGVGRGTESAWADGAGIVEGLATGTASGVWEGLQWYIGAKIGSFNITKGTGVDAKVANSLARVVLDSVDGAAEGVAQPLIQSIYKDGYYDEFGNYQAFDSKDGILKRFNELFDDAGGFNNVLTNAAVGGISSSVGEAFDLGKILKDNKITNDIKILSAEEFDKLPVAEKFDYTYDYDKKGYVFKNAEPEVLSASEIKVEVPSGNDYKFPMDSIDEVRRPYVEDWFEDVTIDKEIGQKLEEMFFDDNYIYGVHRTNDILSANDINKDGLWLTGDTASGASARNSNLDFDDLQNNISFQQGKTSYDYARFLRDITTASYYKNYMGNNVGYAMIVKIPKDKISNLDDIIDYSGIQPVLKSEYVVGKIEVDNGNVSLSDNTEIGGIKYIKNITTKLDTGIDAAIYFNDPNQYMYQTVVDFYQKTNRIFELNSFKANAGKTSQMNVEFLTTKFNEIATLENNKILSELKNNAREFNQLERDVVSSYTRATGPIITAYLRNTDYHFSNQTIPINNRLALEGKFEQGWALSSIGASSIGIEKATITMDNIINTSSPLKENLMVYRGADGLFLNGTEINLSDIKPGTVFNDKAFVSTSVVNSSIYSNYKYSLEIELPKGTKAAYIESISGTRGYGQQELLLGRNCNFEITSNPELVEVMIDGKLQKRVIIKAKLVDSQQVPLDLSFKGEYLDNANRNKLQQNYNDNYDENGNYRDYVGDTEDLTEVLQAAKNLTSEEKVND